MVIIGFGKGLATSRYCQFDSKEQNYMQLDQNIEVIFQENEFEHILSKTMIIFLRPLCFNKLGSW